MGYASARAKLSGILCSKFYRYGYNWGMSMTIDNFQYLSVSEAATRIGCTVGRVRQLLIDGILVGRKVNARAWIISPSSVEEVKNAVHDRGRPRKSKKTG